MKYLFLAALLLGAAACQPLNDGTAGMRLNIAHHACEFTRESGGTGAGSTRQMQACVVITTSGATANTPTSTVTPTTNVSVPVSAVPTLP